MGAMGLPAKEYGLFQVIQMCLERERYETGLKAADEILKRFPDHGETLAMKGLMLNCLDRRSEAYESVRRGLKNDLQSHVLWHIYGQLYSFDREYRESMKCYKNALRWDPENVDYLRDLSLLEIHMQDFPGLIETSQRILKLEPHYRINWIVLAVAHHCNSDAARAVQILEAYEGTLKADYPPENERYEHSEMLMYKVTLLAESGSTERALVELESKEPRIVDVVGFKEQRATLLLALNRFTEAESVFRHLLDMNPDNYDYYAGLQKCRGFPDLSAVNGEDDDGTGRLMEIYASLQKTYPKSSAAKRIPLDFLQGNRFLEVVRVYMRPFLAKGVPSLFSDLLPLYDQAGKAEILEKAILEAEKTLKEEGRLPDESEMESPATIMWTLFLLAQHLDRRGEFERALTKINEAIAHTPTAIDLYLFKGKLLKHVGDPVGAAALTDEARSMDPGDQFLNTVAVKRMLKADQIDRAEKTKALFIIGYESETGCFDVPSMWNELALGDSYWRKGSTEKALKHYLTVERYYSNMFDEQLGMHTGFLEGSLRGFSIRAYSQMIKFQDRLFSHRLFLRAAAASIRCYLALYDSPPKTCKGKANDEETASAGLLAADKESLRQKKKMQAKKVTTEKAREDQVPAAETQVSSPLKEASKFSKLLQEYAPDALQTHSLAFEIYLRKKKIILAFRALKRQQNLTPDDPVTHRNIFRFFNMVDRLPAPQTRAEKVVHSVIAAERASLSTVWPSKTAIQLLRKEKKKKKNSLERKKLFEAQVEQLGQDQLRLHDQMTLLEGAKATTDTVDALPSGANAMKAIQKATSRATNVDDVDRTMESINEQSRQPEADTGGFVDRSWTGC